MVELCVCMYFLSTAKKHWLRKESLKFDCLNLFVDSVSG